ncbi:MAG TPA: hypothetical protein VLG66_12110 [Alphaproteobacteria bacterium]|nr:hypothetical protein [Alphaproteobacteria bacterium]
MSALRVASEYFRLRRAQRLNAAAMRQLRDRKLRRIVRHAYETVPFYREHFRQANVTPDLIQSLDDLPRLPVVTARHLQAAGIESVTSSSFSRDELISHRTTGSTGRPLTIRWDPRWSAIQKALFLRALFAAGYLLGDKAMILTEDIESRSTPNWLRWRYVNYDAPPGALVADFNAFRPVVLYGWVTPLRRLALHIRASGPPIHRPRAIITTAEALDGETRRLFADVFGADVFEIYGLTEMGTVASECIRHNGLHLSDETIIAEFPDIGTGGDISRLILTNLDLKAMPFIRYETGDIVRLDRSEPCGCDRRSPRIAAIEGRVVDCVRSHDGRSILPYDFTWEIKQIDGIERYRIIQNDLQNFTVCYEGAPDSAGAREARIIEVIRKLVGGDARVEVRRMDNLDPPPGQKFRIVESRLATSR